MAKCHCAELLDISPVLENVESTEVFTESRRICFTGSSSHAIMPVIFPCFSEYLVLYTVGKQLFDRLLNLQVCSLIKKCKVSNFYGSFTLME